MANFEAFRWNFTSSTNPEIGRSGVKNKKKVQYLWVMCVPVVARLPQSMFSKFLQLFLCLQLYFLGTKSAFGRIIQTQS